MSAVDLYDKNKAYYDKLVESVMTGVATEQEQGILLRGLQVGISANLCDNLSVLGRNVKDLSNLAIRLQQKYMQKVTENEDDMDLTQLRTEFMALTDMTIKALELQRRVLQGKSLFPDDTMSDADRKLLYILNSLGPNDKDRVTRVLEKEFISSVAQHAEDVTDTATDDTDCSCEVSVDVSTGEVIE